MYCLDGCCRFAPEAGLECDSQEEKRLEEGERGGHDQTTGRSATEEEHAGQSVQKHRSMGIILVQFCGDCARLSFQFPNFLPPFFSVSDVENAQNCSPIAHS